MARISTPTTQHPDKSTKSNEEKPSAHVIRNILSYSKSLQVKPSVYLGKVQHVNN
ncbi:MAG: hypothetical protein ACHQF2_02835 [Flavobacteriales bacterium]